VYFFFLPFRRYVELLDRGLGVPQRSRFTHVHTWLPAPLLRDALRDVERYAAHPQAVEAEARSRAVKARAAKETRQQTTS
jgi:hypothetical protein